MSDSPFFLDDSSGAGPDCCERCGDSVDGPYRLCDSCHKYRKQQRLYAHSAVEAWFLVLRLGRLPEEVDPIRVERLLTRALARYERRWKVEHVQPHVWPPVVLD